MSEPVIQASASSPPALKRLDARQLALARQAQSTRGRLDQVAAELGAANEEESLKAVAASLGLEFVELTSTKIDLGLLRRFPIKLIHRYNVFPLRLEEGSLVLAIGNPFNLDAVDAVGAATGQSVLPVLTFPDELAKLIKNHLGVGAETIDGLLAQQEDRVGDVEILEDLEFDRSEASEAAQEPSVVRLVNEILTEAVEARASDIHVEAQASGIKIRYRIDGVLQKQTMPPEINRFYNAIISRIKIMARLNIAEKRVPQDGRIKLKVSGREVDIRVSLIPMLHGEGVVMRVLDKEKMTFSLRGVGMDQDIYERFNHLIQLPHGIVLVTGPTGSGKTTTLYSALNEIKDESTKIITTEDPIEYQLEGINQIQVHAKVGLTFAASLRSILRHDPDVILVGEIRDHETAENAIQAALTGHLVFSTLHTNDAAGAFMRMIDIGVEPYLVTSTVEGVMAQRLVRTLCRECRETYQPRAMELPSDFPVEEVLQDEKNLYRAVGCRACRGTGYNGRSGIYELMFTNDEVRKLVGDRAPTNLIKQVAMKAGMRSLRQDGWIKVLRGQTTIDEVLRVTKAD
jgi:general secretion pathway protein E/type IV pilus assembly protein PilB